MRFQVQKYEKYLMSKNDFERPLGPFNKELWSIEVFFGTWSNFKSIYPFGKRYKNIFGKLESITQSRENSSKNSLTEKTSLLRGKLVNFSKKFQSKKYNLTFKNVKNT